MDATQEPYSEGYNMYTYVSEELPSLVFSEFPQLDSDRVSIMGHSMGGHGALTLVSCRRLDDTLLTWLANGGQGSVLCLHPGLGANGTQFLRNPGKYQSVSAFAPICNPINSPWGQKAFSGYFGDSDRDLWKEHDATELVKRWKGPLKMLIDVV